MINKINPYTYLRKTKNTARLYNQFNIRKKYLLSQWMRERVDKTFGANNYLPWEKKHNQFSGNSDLFNYDKNWYCDSFHPSDSQPFDCKSFV